MASQTHDQCGRPSRRYSTIAETRGATTCCDMPVATPMRRHTGWATLPDTQAVPEGANLGLGCGNPVAIASLRPGDVVVDLGSGAGFDCFLAAPAVGATGKVIGIDMTPAMLSKARENATTGHFTNVEFRLGEIEHLPVADESVDVIISNYVINLSPESPRCFKRRIVS
jgi:SAM-dependent methyltransferase